MSQHGRFEQDYLRMKVQIDKLKASGLSEEQRTIFSKLDKMIQHFEHHLFTEYIDFEEICDNLPDAIYVASPDGTSIYVNDTYTKLSGITKAEIIGENVHQINREKKLYTNGILPTILKYQKRSEIIGVMKKTNTTVHISGFPIFNDKHELKYAVACDRDIQQLETVKDQLIQLKSAIEKKENENSYLRTQQIQQSEVIFKSDQMYQAVSTALAVAPTDATVLITGESGTGKEVMAGSIHNASRRGSKPFLSINSAAIPATLMESELFGYEPGAFTSGKKNGSPGMFEFAHGGTLFLDEIGEMPLELQSKLLRVIQEKEVRRIGASRVIPVDVRIIAATNKDLNGEVAANRFRADLYYRLNILHLHLPPLRAYTESAGEIAEKILRKLAPGSEPDRAAPLRALLAKTGQYRWPGNLRELENIVRRYLALSPYLSRSIKLSDIFEPSELAEGPRESGGWENSGELQKILSTYYRMGCSKTLTAQELGISRSTLWRKLRQIRNPDS